MTSIPTRNTQYEKVRFFSTEYVGIPGDLRSSNDVYNIVGKYHQKHSPGKKTRVRSTAHVLNCKPTDFRVYLEPFIFGVQKPQKLQFLDSQFAAYLVAQTYKPISERKDETLG